MKKKTCALLISAALMLTSLAACGGNGADDPKQTESPSQTPSQTQSQTEAPDMTDAELLKAIYDANKTENILKHYDSLLAEYKMYHESSDQWSEGYTYADGNRCVNEIGSQFILYEVGANHAITRYSENEADPLYLSLFGEGNDGYERRFYENLFLAYNEDEKIVSNSEENGTLTVVSETPTVTPETQAFDIEYAEGDILVTEYVLDSETLILQKINSKIRHVDGVECDVMAEEITFNTECPEPPEVYTETFENPEVASDPLTVVFNPGTDKETEYSVQLPHKAAFYLDCDMELYPGIYTDPDCTVPFEGLDDATRGSEITLYCAEGK